MTIENYPDIERIIECVDCGGDAHLLTALPEDDLYPGDVLVYRCADCMGPMGHHLRPGQRAHLSRRKPCPREPENAPRGGAATQ